MAWHCAINTAVYLVQRSCLCRSFVTTVLVSLGWRTSAYTGWAACRRVESTVSCEQHTPHTTNLHDTCYQAASGTCCIYMWQKSTAATMASCTWKVWYRSEQCEQCTCSLVNRPFSATKLYYEGNKHKKKNVHVWYDVRYRNCCARWTHVRTILVVHGTYWNNIHRYIFFVHQ